MFGTPGGTDGEGLSSWESVLPKELAGFGEVCGDVARGGERVDKEALTKCYVILMQSAPSGKIKLA